MSAALPPPGWYSRPDRLDGLRWWDGTSWTDHEAPLPTPGWYPDPSQRGLLRWWDGDWKAQTKPHPDFERNIWSRWFIILIVCWLATLATSLGITVALAPALAGHQTWWIASTPLLVELGVTLAVGAALGWRRLWVEAGILGLSSGVVVAGAFMFGAATNPEPGADDAAGAGLVIIGAPTVIAITVIVLLGGVLGAAGRWVRFAAMPRNSASSA